jgi:hypothetical protein
MIFLLGHRVIRRIDDLDMQLQKLQRIVQNGLAKVVKPEEPDDVSLMTPVEELERSVDALNSDLLKVTEETKTIFYRLDNMLNAIDHMQKQLVLMTDTHQHVGVLFTEGGRYIKYPDFLEREPSVTPPEPPPHIESPMENLVA